MPAAKHEADSTGKEGHRMTKRDTGPPALSGELDQNLRGRQRMERISSCQDERTGAPSGSRSRGVTGNGHFLDFSGLVGYICAIWNLRHERRRTRPLRPRTSVRAPSSIQGPARLTLLEAFGPDASNSAFKLPVEQLWPRS